MAMNGYRFTVERQRLCAWLEDERSKLAGIANPERQRRSLELEQEFRIRLDGLFAEARPELKARDAAAERP